jgi:hypothetical protein
MGYDDQRDIFERLEALERLAHSRSGERGGWEEHRHGGRDGHDRDRHDRDRRDRDRHDRDRHHDRGRGGDEFDEKRFIDTIVRLVGERVERTVQDQQGKMRAHDDDGGEKRVVDLVVRLVGEHVREIVQQVVSTELDRRLGRSGGEPPHDESSEPEQR